MKKLHWLLVILSLFASSLVLAQSGNNANCQDPSSSLLWKIQGKNSEVYLFGSLHLGLPEFYPLAKEIDQAFRSADYLVFEVDPTGMNDPALVQTMLQQGMLGPNEQLSDRLSPAVIEELETTMQAMGLPAQQFMRFRPWFITITLSTLQMVNLGYQPNYGVELYLLNQKSADTKILELETMAEQLSFLVALDTEAYLEYTLKNMEQGKSMMQAMANAWACADKPLLTELLVDSMDMEGVDSTELDQLKATFLYDRNVKMANKIQDFVQNGSGTYFVVVGAAHYLGDKSVVDVLQKKGISVQSVKLKR